MKTTFTVVYRFSKIWWFDYVALVDVVAMYSNHILATIQIFNFKHIN